MSRARRLVVGVVSDTHGLVRPEALAALAGADAIVHAGDVGAPEVLDALAAIAPVVAVRGNNDRGPWAARLPAATTVAIGAVRVHVVHDRADLGDDVRDVAVVVTGHSHRPSLERRGNVLFLNPGSAGPRRFTLPVSVARLTVDGTRVSGRIVVLRETPSRITPRGARSRPPRSRSAPRRRSGV